jgi:hypothetical protein
VCNVRFGDGDDIDADLVDLPASLVEARIARGLFYVDLGRS